MLIGAAIKRVKIRTQLRCPSVDEQSDAYVRMELESTVLSEISQHRKKPSGSSVDCMEESLLKTGRGNQKLSDGT